MGVLRYSGKATDVSTREKLAALASMLAQEALIDAAKVSQGNRSVGWWIVLCCVVLCLMVIGGIHCVANCLLVRAAAGSKESN